MEVPLASGDFLVAGQHDIQNDVEKSADTRVLWRKEEIAICPSLKVGDSSGVEGSLPHASRNVVPASHLPLSVVTDVASLAPGDCQMPNNCFKQCNIVLESKTCSTSNPIGASGAAAENINICHLSFDNITSADAKLTCLENNNDRENELLYYDWSDINNFEDVDNMFRPWNNTDGLSWVSSTSNDIFCPEDAFTSGLEFTTFDDSSAYCAIRSLPKSSTPGADKHRQSCLTQQSFEFLTSSEQMSLQAYDVGGVADTKSALTEVANVNTLDEREPHITMKLQQLDRQ